MIFTISTNQTKANRPALPQAVEITYLNISGTAKAGDTFNLVVRYKARDTGKIEMTFNFPDDVAPLNRTTGETYRTDTVQVNIKDSVYERIYQVKAFVAGRSILEINLRRLQSMPHYSPRAMKQLGIIHNTITYQAGNPNSMPQDTLQVVGDNYTIKKDRIQANYNVSISGKVTYNSVDIDGSIVPNGVYGIKVRAYFQRSFTGTSYPRELYTPYAEVTPTNEVEGTHYARCSDDGSYSLNFSFNTTKDMSRYDRIAIYVELRNDAAYMLKRFYSGVMQSPAYIKTIFNYEPTTVFYNGGSNISLNNLNYITPALEGATFRYAQMSREFALAKIGTSLPVIEYRLEDLGDGYSGIFCPSIVSDQDCDGWLHIGINPSYAYDIFTNSHEYAHYHIYELKTGGWRDAILSEGYATFFSFACANYIEKTYGDKFAREEDGIENVDNCELGAYSNPKFINIFYAKSIYYAPGILSMEYREFGLKVAQFACFLWNLYDGYDDAIAGVSVIKDYDKGDNDDVSEGNRVFLALAFSNKNMKYSDFKAKFVGYLNSTNTALPDTLNEAVDRIEEYMLTPDLSSIHTMSCAQVKEVKVIRLSANICRLTWQNQLYTDLNAAYGHYFNHPSSIRIWGATKQDPNTGEYYDWIIVGYAMYNATTADVTTIFGGIGTNELKAYKVSVYNTSVMNFVKKWSHKAPIHAVPPMTTIIKQPNKQIK